MDDVGAVRREAVLFGLAADEVPEGLDVENVVCEQSAENGQYRSHRVVRPWLRRQAVHVSPQRHSAVLHLQHPLAVVPNNVHGEVDLRLVSKRHGQSHANGAAANEDIARPVRAEVLRNLDEELRLDALLQMQPGVGFRCATTECEKTLQLPCVLKHGAGTV